MSMSQTPLKFPKDGVCLRVFDRFISEVCGGIDKIPKDMTTTDVCTTFLLPHTQALRCSYCEFLQQSGQGATGTAGSSAEVAPATVFISHAWKYRFLDVVEALRQHFRDETESTFIWFDLFSNNQHCAPDLDYHWWSTTFKSAIAQFGRTVMILAPWSDPIPFRRAWCLFEIYCTKESGSRFEVAMSRAESDDLITALTNSSDKFFQMIANIDLRQSEAFKTTDRDKIFETVEQTIGFSNLNSMIFAQLRDWVISTVQFFIDDGGTDLRSKYNFKHTLGSLHLMQGNFDSAIAELNSCLAGKDEIIASSAVSLTSEEISSMWEYEARVLGTLAQVYKGQDKLEKALSISEKCLELTRLYLQNDHPYRYNIMNNTANIYFSQDRFDLAEPLYAECHEYLLRVLGPDNLETVTAAGNLGGMFQRLGLYEKAEPLCVSCYESYQKCYGLDHPLALKACSNLGYLYLSQKRYDEALPLLERCLEIYTTKLGPDNPSTLKSKSNLALLFSATGRYSEAVELFSNCLAGQQTVLGANHSETLCTMGNLTTALRRQGNIHEATSKCEACVEQMLVVLGPDHTETMRTTNNLAVLYAMQGLFDKAEPLFRRIVDDSITKFGLSHIEPLNAMKNLAFLLRQTQKFDEASAVAASCLQVAENAFSTVDLNHPEIVQCRRNIQELLDEKDLLSQAAYTETLLTKYPVEVTRLDHHPHKLILGQVAYPGGRFGCDVCKRLGKAWAYSCQQCGFDAHLHCGYSMPDEPPTI